MAVTCLDNEIEKFIKTGVDQFGSAFQRTEVFRNMKMKGRLDENTINLVLIHRILAASCHDIKFSSCVTFNARTTDC